MARKRWSEGDLTIAYYLARFGKNDFDKTKEQIVKEVIKDTSIKSLNMQVANFRFLLDIEGEQLRGYTKNKIEIINKLRGRSRTYIFALIDLIIFESENNPNEDRSIIDFIFSSRIRYIITNPL